MNQTPLYTKVSYTNVVAMTDNYLEPKSVNINWDELRRQLEWDNALEKQSQLQKRLRHRALIYSAPVVDDEYDSEEELFIGLSFHLGKERYAIDVTHIRGVRPAESVTRVPGTPSFLRGVINVRGQIISLFDLRRFFDVSTNTDKLPSEIIIVSAHGIELGILADHVQDVVTIPMNGIDPIEMRYAKGIRATTKLMILDIDQLFSDERLSPEGMDES